jgi:hypothetical protein
MLGAERGGGKISPSASMRLLIWLIDSPDVGRRGMTQYTIPHGTSLLKVRLQPAVFETGFQFRALDEKELARTPSHPPFTDEHDTVLC